MVKTEYIYNAVVTNVVDGDTIDAEVDLGFRMYAKLRFRLAFINTPEVNSKDPVLNQKAQEAKDYLSKNVLGQKVTIESHKSDKYGRWLAVVYVNQVNINKALLDIGLAVPYKE